MKETSDVQRELYAAVLLASGDVDVALGRLRACAEEWQYLRGDRVPSPVSEAVAASEKGLVRALALLGVALFTTKEWTP